MSVSFPSMGSSYIGGRCKQCGGFPSFSLDPLASIRISQALKSSFKILLKPLKENLTTPGSELSCFPLYKLASRKYLMGLRNK